MKRAFYGNIYWLTFVTAHMVLQRDLLSEQTKLPQDMLGKCTALTKKEPLF